MTRIFLSPPDVGEEERQALLDAFDSNWIAPLGPAVDAFEHEMAKRVGVDHAVALSSGTAALHLALMLLDIGNADEVIVPTLTFAATANVVTYVGARPVLIDSDAATWTIDPGLLIEEIRSRARRGCLPAAVITVDLYGQCADYSPILEICDEFEIPVIEDAAEALGATYRGRPAGSFGNAGVFSFNGNKIITTSGGGMLVTGSADFAERARHLATQAREPFSHYEHTEVGYNYRLSNLLAALGRAQLRGLESRVERRKEIDAVYMARLAILPGVSPMPRTVVGTSNYWLTCILIDPGSFGADREEVRVALEAADIESRPTWKPLHLQPAFSGATFVGPGNCARVFEQGLCLPTGSSLSSADQSRVIEVVTAQAGG
jgi:dTDP-4-amino-4,6-dideoxygalactose transaminase